VYQKIKGAHIFSTDDSSISNGREKVRGYVIDRTIFDRHLLQRVAKAGRMLGVGRIALRAMMG